MKIAGQLNTTVMYFIKFIVAIISLYGVYALVKRNLASYMFLKSHFVMFDYSEPIFLFLADYLTIMILFIVVGYYLSQFLRKAGQSIGY